MGMKRHLKMQTCKKVHNVDSSKRTWRVSFKGDYPMWCCEAITAEGAISQIAKLNNLDKSKLEAK